MKEYEIPCVFIGGFFDGEVHELDIHRKNWQMLKPTKDRSFGEVLIYTRQIYNYSKPWASSINEVNSFVFYSFGNPDKALKESKIKVDDIAASSVLFTQERLRFILLDEKVKYGI